ncbi:sugar ABC transporter permease [Candidatus Bipolaricaulota bacterium]|nr:sugar ABC transporter permease [Candidatus Bipolaricaulota bacterium]
MKGWRQIVQVFSTRDSMGYLFIAPAMLYLLTLLVYPVLYNFWLSFYKSEYGSSAFVGLQNYIRAVTARGFGQVMLNTVVWTVGNMVVMYVLALLAAVILRNIPRGKVVFRTILLLPWVVPGVVAGILWQFMLHSRFGIVNDLLMKLGFIDKPVFWLANPNTSLLAVMVTYIWKVYPYIMILLMAGLEAVQNELYEAAAVDGANGWQQFRHITLPLLGPVTRVIVILMGIWTFNSFDLTFIMTKGGPLYSSEILAMRIYSTAFSDFRFGLASATSVLAFFITFTFASVYILFTRRQEK